MDAADTDAVIAELDGAAMLWLETPTNPLVGIADLRRLAEAASERGIPTVVDNTFATPLLQRPLELGCDIVVHSATKLIGGHSDLLLGIAVARDGDKAEELHGVRHDAGATPGGLEAWLALRGLRTLPVRIERMQATALLIAERLRDHAEVIAVHYPGLPNDPGYELASRADGRLRHDARAAGEGRPGSGRCAMRERPAHHPRNQPRRCGDADREPGRRARRGAPS